MANLNYNRVTIAGKLCADPEQRQTQTGIPVTSFSVAVNRRVARSAADGSQPQQTADFFKVVAWRSTAEFVARYFRKGSSILVEGSLQERSWTDQQGQKRYVTEIVADDVYFVDSKSESPANRDNSYYNEPSPAPAFSAPASEAPKFEDISSDDDLPF